MSGSQSCYSSFDQALKQMSETKCLGNLFLNSDNRTINTNYRALSCKQGFVIISIETLYLTAAIKHQLLDTSLEAGSGHNHAQVQASGKCAQLISSLVTGD